MNKIYSGLGKTHDAITDIGYWLGVLALFAILLMFCYEITARYFFRSPTQWINDFTGYFLLFSTFLLAPRLTRERAHIEITFIKDALSEKARGCFSSLLFLLATIACIWAGWYAFEEAMRQYDRGIRTMAVMSVPRWWMSAVISYGLMSSGVYFFRASVMELKSSLVSRDL